MKKFKALALLLVCAFILSSFCCCSSDIRDKHSSRRDREEDEEDEDEDEDEEEEEETTETSETEDRSGIDLFELDGLMSDILGTDHDSARTSIEDIFDVTLSNATTSETYDGTGYSDEYYVNVEIDGYMFNKIVFDYTSNSNTVTLISFMTEYTDSFSDVLGLHDYFRGRIESSLDDTVVESDPAESSYLRYSAYMDPYGNEIFVMGGNWSADNEVGYGLLSFSMPSFDDGGSSDTFTSYDTSGFADLEPVMESLLYEDHETAIDTLIFETGAALYNGPSEYYLNDGSGKVSYTYDVYLVVGELYFNQVIIDCHADDDSVICITITNTSCDAPSALEVYETLEEFCDMNYGTPTVEVEGQTQLDTSVYYGPSGEIVCVYGGSQDDDLSFGEFGFIVAAP